MEKIPTVLVRDFTRDNGRYVTDEVTTGCEWVLAGEGIPTRKYDGTCVGYLDLGNGPQWYGRREVKQGKNAPDGYVEVEYDTTTNKSVGWEPIEQTPFYAAFTEALAVHQEQDHGWNPPVVGTYELVGPKVNGNPEGFGGHAMLLHEDAEKVPALAHGFDPADLVRRSGTLGWEGIVWHHPDGRMAKLKVRDLRPPEPQPEESHPAFRQGRS